MTRIDTVKNQIPYFLYCLYKILYETYKRFLVREPTEAETTYFKNYINSDPNVTPELVYFAFALSNEYLFY